MFGKRKWIAAGLIVAIVLILSAGITWVTFLHREVGESVSDSDTVTLDWYINYSWFKSTWGDSAVATEITSKTGVDINFITPVGSESNTLSTMISSDTLPDLVTIGFWEPQVNEMIEKGQVYALNELADQYDPLFYEVSDPDSVRWYTLSDGNIYAYPNSSYTIKDVEEHDDIPSNQVFIVRKDIYEAIGSPDMTTPEGFINAIHAAAEMFPEVDGKSLIPVGSNFFDDGGCTSFDQYLQNSLAVPYEKDGLFYDRNTDEEYLSWLKVFRQLNEEGYLSPEIFVDERTQITEKIREGRYFCMFYQSTDLVDQENEIYQTEPERVYIAVDGPRNTAKDDPILPTSSVQGWTVTLISKNCKDPEKAIQLMDYMMSEEGQKTIYLGVEGITYDVVDGEIVINPEVTKLREENRTKYDELYAADDTYWMLQDNVMQLQWKLPVAEPLRKMQEYTYPYVQYTGQYSFSIPENTSLGQKYTDLRKLWSETLKQLLIASSEESFDEIVENYLIKREEMGYKEVFEEQNRQMNENKERLGIAE